ncbi:hypothetical protein [Deinococcus sp.]|uniref:hypothetical protein n=1 Tax=Deinococcus sp. TaxID=47478 RepID=UPI003919D5E1
MRAAFLRGALLAGLLGLGAAQATVAPTLSLEQQARRAEVIVRATLGSPVDVRDGDVTYVAYPLTVTETIAGDPATLPRHEGAPALLFLKGASDLPQLRAGQDVIALLYSARMDSPVVGFNQGLYPVVNGSLVPGVALGTATPPTSAAPASTAPASTTPASTAPASGGTTPAPTTAPLPAPIPAPGSTPGGPPADPPAATPADPATPLITDPAKLRAAILAAREARP